MLKRVGGSEEKKNSIIDIKDAVYPNIFNIGLEFNAPVHGTWNIVHIGLLMPESHQIYVCADNCMRGVVMTAMEMDYTDNFHSVILYEQDILKGSLEEETIEGVSDVIEKLGYHPPVIQIFTVCLHEFLGSDKDYIYRELEKRYPDIVFLRCFMDPINQRTSYTPEQKLRRAMLECIKPLDIKNNIYVLGCDMPLNKDSYIHKLAKYYGFNVKEIFDMKTFAEYMEIGDGALFITNYPTGVLGVSELADRLGRKFLYLPFSNDTRVIDEQMETLEYTLRNLSGTGNEGKWDCCATDEELHYKTIVEVGRNKLENTLMKVKENFKNTEIAVDYMAHPRPYELVEFLLDNGLNVTSIWADTVSEEDKDAFLRLKEKTLKGEYKNIKIYSTIRTEGRVLKSEFVNENKVVAIGQKAAWFNETEYFVNQVESGGLIGYEGMCLLLEKMIEAINNKKDLHDIVPRKAIGHCSNCAIV